MTRHEWRDRDEDDAPRRVRARLFGGRWTLHARRPGEPGWTELSPPPLDDLYALRDVLWRKYRRGRVPHEQITALDALIARRGGEPAGDA